MKIKKIKIQKLFGLFNYDIELNQNEDITILTGPNGYGKTTILNIIYNLFNHRFFYFQKLNFETISIFFNEEQRIELTKKQGKTKPEQAIRIVNNQPQVYSQQISTTDIQLDLFDKHGKPLENFTYNSDTENKLLIELGKYIPVQKISQNIVLEANTGRQLSLRDFLAEYINYLPIKVISLINRQETTQISQLLNSANVYIIREERLLTQTRKSNQNISFDRTIEMYSKELKNIIEQKQLEAYQKAQQLDSSFPKRLIECKEFLSEDDFRNKFAALTKKQELLQTFGIATTKQDVTEYNNETKNVLTVYLEDSEEKVRVYDELLVKIALFVNILNEKRFAFKSIVINGSQGFYFQLSNGQRLRLTDLSSGEQQEVVLLYELLFKTNSNTLILIDEPEISLHVEWQKPFLGDLQKIAKVKQISFLISTHAPSIINDKWNLTKDLFELANAN
ncbi:MAG: AAA family ATPase [Prevotellaceae bacterium]|nr:AAA family ATPase [Prevotellaceae bacterium]